jgi:hypothetical protein
MHSSWRSARSLPKDNVLTLFDQTWSPSKFGIKGSPQASLGASSGTGGRWCRCCWRVEKAFRKRCSHSVRAFCRGVGVGVRLGIVFGWAGVIVGVSFGPINPDNRRLHGFRVVQFRFFAGCFEFIVGERSVATRGEGK